MKLTNEQIKTAYVNYYKRLDVQFEIIKCTKNREFCAIDVYSPKIVVRNMRVQSTQHLTKWLFKLRAGTDKVFNLYCSVATFTHGVPFFKNGLDLKSRLIYNYMDTMRTYDFVLDIDASSFEIAKQSTILIHNYYNRHKIPHKIQFSGSGYHIIVPHKFVNIGQFEGIAHLDPIKFKLQDIAQYLYDIITETIDLQIYDSRRFIKCPYTLIVKQQNIYVCTPILTTEQLENWNLNNYKLQNLAFNIRGRGEYIFNEFLDPKFENFKKTFEKIIK